MVSQLSPATNSAITAHDPGDRGSGRLAHTIAGAAVALEFPVEDRGSGRWVQNAEGVFDVAQTRRYFVQVGRQVLDRELDRDVTEMQEIDLLVPAGIYLNRTEKQAIEAHVANCWQGWTLLGCMSPLVLDADDCTEF